MVRWNRNMRNNLNTIKRRKGNWIDHTLRRNWHLKHIIENKIEGAMDVTGRNEENVNSYWVTLRKRENSGNWKMKQQIAPCGELALKQAKDQW